MEEKLADLLAQYDLAVHRAGRVKGNWILETSRGLKILGSCSYSEGKIKFEQRVKEFAAEKGFPETDIYVPAREQNFLVQGPYGEMFIMKDWFSGEECNVKSREHVDSNTAAAVSADEEFVAFGYPDGMIRIYETAQLYMACERRLIGEAVSALQFAPDRSSLYVLGESGTIYTLEIPPAAVTENLEDMQDLAFARQIAAFVVVDAVAVGIGFADPADQLVERFRIAAELLMFHAVGVFHRKLPPFILCSGPVRGFFPLRF